MLDPTRYVPTDAAPLAPAGGIVLGVVVGGAMWAVVVMLIVWLL